MRRTNVPEVVIHRLPLYLRCLTYMSERDQQVVSSHELAAWVGVSSAQIRKDLSYFGEFGRQGLGYEVVYLRDQLRSILQVDRRWAIVLVGAGALVTEGKSFPDGSLIIGSPAKAIRQLDEAAIEGLRASAMAYVANGKRFRAGLKPV